MWQHLQEKVKKKRCSKIKTKAGCYKRKAENGIYSAFIAEAWTKIEEMDVNLTVG